MKNSTKWFYSNEFQGQMKEFLQNIKVGKDIPNQDKRVILLNDINNISKKVDKK